MKPNDVTDATFQSEVLQAEELVVVDFWAPWCGPCRMIAPILEEIGALYNGKLKISQLNVDENPETAQSFAVRSIPTLIFFKNGMIVDKLIGAVPRKQLESRIDRAIELEQTPGV